MHQQEELLTKQIAWEQEKETIRNINQSDVVKINVGGTTIMTSNKVLASVPDSKLEHTFAGGLTQLKKIDGEVFLDRNGKIFEAMVDYLRDGRQTMPRFSEFNDQIRFT